MSWTYVIIDTASYSPGEGWLVKIGKSKNPHGRIAGFRTANPGRLEILALLPGGEWERLLHATFDEFRLNGEWFRLDLARILVVATLADEHPNGDYDHSLGTSLEKRDPLYATNPCVVACAVHDAGWEAGASEERHEASMRADRAVA